jgi:DnaJ-class molecular chaperone
MKKLKADDRLPEVRCPACEGTGFPNVKQPVQPWRKIYPAPCKECAGKGRIEPQPEH